MKLKNQAHQVFLRQLLRSVNIPGEHLQLAAEVQSEIEAAELAEKPAPAAPVKPGK